MVTSVITASDRTEYVCLLGLERIEPNRSQIRGRTHHDGVVVAESGAEQSEHGRQSDQTASDRRREDLDDEQSDGDQRRERGVLGQHLQ